MNDKETFYAKLSEHYDEIFPLSRSMEQFVLHELPHHQLTSLLDIGCGTGSLAIALSPQVESVTAIDLDDKMINKAKEKNDQAGSLVVFETLNMLEIENQFGRGKFDAAICLGNTIAHLLSIADIELFFQAAAHVLVPGGKFILQGLNYNHILGDGIDSLPLIENGNIRFIRKYQHNAHPELLKFETELTVKGASSVSGSTMHNPVRPELFHSSITEAGFTDLQMFGGFNRSALLPNSLPLIITCVRG